MTDDESRKAFEEWDATFQYAEHDNWLATWQAAVEWATKRERERCLSLVRAWSLAGDRSSTMIREIEEGEEPK